MPKYCADQPGLERVFAALADPTRLAVIERLSLGPANLSTLAAPFTMALPSFLQHMNVLEDAGVVTSHKAGRSRVFQLAPDGFTTARTWLSTQCNHWERRLNQLDEFLLSTPNPIRPGNNQTASTQPTEKP
jgi:DNA-binding transcriptional ArsR family regulator